MFGECTTMARHCCRRHEVLLCLSVAAFLLSAAVTADDGAVMTALLSGLPSPPSGWSESTPYCQWTGVKCDASKRVTSLDLDYKFLPGTLPANLNKLSQLQILYLSHNAFSGPLPSLAGLAHLSEAYLDANAFDSAPSGFLKGLTRLQALGLSDNPNMAPWSLPTDLTESPGLLSLYAANASLMGSLPDIFDNFPDLQVIDLSYNQLTGHIPNTLADLPFLESLNLSDNNFSGRIPPFHPIKSLILDNNPLLASRSPSTFGKSLKVGFAVGWSITLISLVVYLFYVGVPLANQNLNAVDGDGGVQLASQDFIVDVDGDGGVPLARSGDLPVLEDGSVAISFRVLRQATGDFKEDNILGKGGFGVVYKGEFRDGTTVAVKRMKSGAIGSKGNSEFEAEIAVLTKIRHRHLVALLGYCIDEDERLLVYEYMPEGTLTQHLFGQRETLTWKQRVSIALDVARGVEYLHNLAQSSFIHRDLKSSNILLGNDMRAKVADFGLLRNAPDGSGSVETRVAGTFGYLAPEYAATGRVTKKVDVYAFGVVLMEIITGRKAVENNVSGDWIHLVSRFERLLHKQENIPKEIDQTLEHDEETLKSICIVCELAGHCTDKDPLKRPDMGHAVNILSPLVQQWKPSSPEEEASGDIDLNVSLSQALRMWQAGEGTSTMSRTQSLFHSAG